MIRGRFRINYHERGSVRATFESIEASTTFHDNWNEHSEIRVPVRNNTDRVELEITFPCTKAWVLDAQRQLKEIRYQADPPFPVGQFFIIELAGRLFRIELRSPLPLHLFLAQGSISTKLVVYDRSSCGFSAWGEDKFVSHPPELRVPICISKLSSIDECIWLEPFPDGASACICITDHPDFENTAKLKLVQELFRVNDIRFTKAVFPYADAQSSYPAPGMNDRSYAALVDGFFEQGSEIAAHSFDAVSAVPPLAECVRRLENMSRFRPTTWIDHSDGNYLFSRGGRLEDGTLLLDLLDRFSFENYWSYNDAGHNPFSDLACWPESPATLLKNLSLASRRVKLTNFNRAYLAIHTLKSFIGENAYCALRRKLHSHVDRIDFCRSIRAARRLRKSPFYLYDHAAVPFAYSEGSRCIFDTVVLNHVGAQMSPDATDDLVKKSSLLIAHTYIGFSHKSYGFENCFVQQSDPPLLLPSFRKAIEHIGYLSRRRQLKTMPFRDLRRSLAAFRDARLIRRPVCWSIDARNSGFSVCIAGPKQVAEAFEASRSAECLYAGDGHRGRTCGELSYWTVPPLGSLDIWIHSSSREGRPT